MCASLIPSIFLLLLTVNLNLVCAKVMRRVPDVHNSYLDVNHLHAGFWVYTLTPGSRTPRFLAVRDVFIFHNDHLVCREALVHINTCYHNILHWSVHVILHI